MPDATHGEGTVEMGGQNAEVGGRRSEGKVGSRKQSTETSRVGEVSTLRSSATEDGRSGVVKWDL